MTPPLAQAWRDFVGPGATRMNSGITFALAPAGLIGGAVHASRRGTGAMGTAVVAMLAGDLAGGVYVNNTRACAQWYERAGQGMREHVKFAALHLHPAAIAAVDRGIDTRRKPLAWSLAHYGYMLLSTMLIRSFPTHRRVLGVTLTAGGLALDRAIGPSTVAPWFGWTYYPKLLLGHAAASLWSDDEVAT